MHSVELTKVHAINEGHFLPEISPPVKHRHKSRCKQDRDTGVGIQDALRESHYFNSLSEKSGINLQASYVGLQIKQPHNK